MNAISAWRRLSTERSAAEIKSHVARKRAPVTSEKFSVRREPFYCVSEKKA